MLNTPNEYKSTFVVYRDEREFPYDNLDAFSKTVINGIISGHNIRYAVPECLPHLELSQRRLLKRVDLDINSKLTLEKLILEAVQSRY